MEKILDCYQEDEFKIPQYLHRYIKGHTINVFNVILNEYNLTKKEWIAIPENTIVERLGISIPTVIRCLKKLSDKNLILIKKQAQTRLGLTNLYKINFEELRQLKLLEDNSVGKPASHILAMAEEIVNVAVENITVEEVIFLLKDFYSLKEIEKIYENAKSGNIEKLKILLDFDVRRFLILECLLELKENKQVEEDTKFSEIEETHFTKLCSKKSLKMLENILNFNKGEELKLFTKDLTVLLDFNFKKALDYLFEYMGQIILKVDTPLRGMQAKN